MVSDSRGHPLTQAERRPATDDQEPLAFLGVPLTIEGTILGALCVYQRSSRNWADHDLDLLTCLAESLTSEILLSGEGGQPRPPTSTDEPAASQIQTDLLANLGHELRTPLASVVGHAEMLLDPELSPPLRVQAAQAILRDSLLLRRLIDGRIAPERSPTSVGERLQGDTQAVGEAGEDDRSMPRPPNPRGEPGRLGICDSDLAVDSLEGRSLEAASTAVGLSLGKTRVLVVDDNRELRWLLSHHLTRAGLVIDVAENGRMAVEMALAKSHDAILLDMQMPELDGYDAARMLRLAGYSQPIIALTALASGDHRERCLGAGCNDFLIKPVVIPSLLSTLERCLQDGSARRKLSASARLEHSVPAPSVPRGDEPDEGLELLVHEYIRRLPEQAQCLREALRAQDRELMTDLAHRCKGVAPMYGFLRLGERAALIETACRDLEDFDLIEELVDDYQVEVDAILTR